MPSYDEMTPLSALKARLRCFLDYASGRDDDPQGGCPPSPSYAVRRYFEQTGRSDVAELLEEAESYY